MAKPYYVKFEVPENLVSPIYESLRVAVETRKSKGVQMRLQKQLKEV